MRIFLSWSGDRSRYLSTCFKNWLPNVLQYLEPYMSSQDIKLGERWGTNIEENLRENDFGLVFVTPENIDAPWINFEAGALSKALKSRLVPVIYGDDVTILNTGPLKQFQSSKNLEKDSVKQLVLDINEYASDTERLKIDKVELAFEKWWDELETELQNIPSLDTKTTKLEEEIPTDNQLLNVILREVKEMKRISNHSGGRNLFSLPEGLFNDLDKIQFNIDKVINTDVDVYGEEEREILVTSASILEDISRYLNRNRGRVRREVIRE